MKILLVDDDPAILLVASMALEELNDVQIIQAQEGRQALLQASAERPDAILMDVILPDISGTEVLRRLKKDPTTRDIPVILHTAKSSPSDIQDLLDAGARGVICKPFNPLKLFDEMSKILESSQPEDEKKRAGR